jgi:hypothetical protein
MSTLNKYWISWYCPFGRMGKFELHSPWWVSGESEDAFTICAAVQAKNEPEAKQIIRQCHDEPRPNTIHWRFCDQRAEDWSPFCDRFPRASWMKWEDKA